METREETPIEKIIRQKAILAEDLTPEQRERWLAFYRKIMQRRRESEAEMREFRNTPEYKEATEQLKKDNAERGTPFL